MQQYYRSVCERQQQAVHRDQALLQDARQAHSRAASSLTTTAVDTSRLEALKTQYQASIASLHPQWLAQVNAQRESLRLSTKSQPMTAHSVLHTHSRVTTQTSPTDHDSFGFEPITTVAIAPPHTPSPSAPLVPSTDVSIVSVPISYSPALLSTATCTTYAPSSSGGSVHIPSHVHSAHTPLLAMPMLHPVSYMSAGAVTTSHPQPPSSVLPQSLPSPISPSRVSRSGSSLHDSTDYHGRQQPDPLLLASKPTLPVSQEIPVSAVQQTRSKPPVHSHTIASTQLSTVPINTREIAGDMSPLEFGPSTVVLKPVVTNREMPMAAALVEMAPTTTSTPTTTFTQHSPSSALASTPSVVPQPTNSTKQLTATPPTTTVHTALSSTTTTHTMTHMITPTAVTTVSGFASSATTQHDPANDSLSTPTTHDAVDRDTDPQPLDCLPSASTKPQNVLILSQENLDSLSETPLDLTEEEGGSQAGNSTDCTHTGLGDHAKESGHSEASLLQVQSTKSLSLDPLPPNLQHVVDETRQCAPRAAVSSASTDSSEEADERERARVPGSEREQDAMMMMMMEGRNGNEARVGEDQVIQSKEEESTTFDESDSISLRVPLPLSPDHHPQPKPTARAMSSNVHVGGRVGPTDSTGSSTESQVELRGGSIDTGVVNSQRNEDTEESNSPDHQSQDGTDAYATFLQTVRHTSGTDALALLDSESEDIEANIATGVRSDSELENTSSLSSAAIGAEGGGGSRETDKSGQGEQQPHLMSASALATPLRRKVKGGERRGRDEEKASLDDSDSSGSQSMHATPSYIPTAMEEQPGSQSSVLKKRLGFWGSEDSLDGSDLALSKSPTAAAAEDDKADFDFYV